MNKTVEGLYTLRIPNVKEILKEGPRNERKRNAESYGDMTRWSFGAFTTDVIEWEIRGYPLGDELRLYLRVLQTNGARIQRYGYVNLQQNHRGDGGRWCVGQNTKLGHELVFQKDAFATEVDLPMVSLNKLDQNTLNTIVSADGALVIKMAIWFILDPRPPGVAIGSIAAARRG